MYSRLKYLRLATVAFFLSAGVAYACPGTTLAHETPVKVSAAAAAHDMGETDGCGDSHVNTCQSVRDQMLSGTVSPGKAAVEAQRLSERPPAALAAAAPVEIFSGASPPTAAFHPVFKLPLSFSYLVLRL